MIDARFHQPGHGKRRAVHVHDVTRGMHDHDGTVRRGAVKIKPGDPHIFHIDRVQPPTDHRGVAGLGRDGLAQAIKNGLDGFQPGQTLPSGSV